MTDSTTTARRTGAPATGAPSTTPATTPATRTPLAHPDAPARHADTRLGAAHGPTGVEPWVKLMIAALVPALAALYVPHAWKLALFALTGVLFVAGLVMLVRQEGARD